MSSPSARAAHLRGALVGGCSALTTALAHTVGGGGLPSGAAVPTLLLVCATVGGVASRVPRTGRTPDVATLVAALCAAQFLGHLALVVAGGHHGAATTSAPMLVAHVGAAVVLAVLISASEYLYVLASSVSNWLRLVALDRSPTAVRRSWWPVDVVVPQANSLCSGLGMRAPPAWSPLGA
ncbi:hypothetical protein CIW49_14795 [Mycolicibacterium sp. P1-18]|uniref:hypothetical protein n=1 Tax=Mycolicibacterium sp. P1-18 TaxID=2024615 RepID=UPI0011F32DD5|nr:hypothetical protein [Mycolicibacterium sp. P1-18]KAA0097948.1 hypothetical protein CIW49_14795 [Mycolicibacterium sp. P1-18]